MAIERLRPKWFNIHEVCEFLDITPSHFRNTIIPNIDGKWVDKSQKQHLYYGKAVVRAFTRPSEPDTVISGTDKHTLRLKRAQADMAEMKRDEYAGVLIPVQAVYRPLNFLGSQLKNACLRLRELYGDPAAEIIRNVIEDYEGQIEEMCKSLDFGAFDGDEKRETEKSTQDKT